MHRLGHRIREPRQALQRVEVRGLDGADAPELLHQALLARRAESRDVVEDRLGHAPVPQLAVVADGEPVGLVPDALEEVQGLALPRDSHGVGLAGHEDLLEPLGQGGHGDLLLEAEIPDHPAGDGELGLAAVHEEQLGRIGEPARPLGRGPLAVGEVGGEPAGEDLGHGAHVVVVVDLTEAEAAVVALLREPVLHDHHGAHVVLALDVAHVVALDAQWRRGQAEVVLELVEGAGPAVVVRRPAEPVPRELLRGVPRDGLLEGALLSPLRDADGDP